MSYLNLEELIKYDYFADYVNKKKLNKWIIVDQNNNVTLAYTTKNIKEMRDQLAETNLSFGGWHLSYRYSNQRNVDKWAPGTVYSVYKVFQKKGLVQKKEITDSLFDQISKQLRKDFPNIPSVSIATCRSQYDSFVAPIRNIQSDTDISQEEKQQIENQIIKRKEAKKRQITKEKEMRKKKVNDGTGIYGIYMTKEGKSSVLVYVGKTSVSFTQRFSQHVIALKGGNQQYLYQKMREFKSKGYNFIMTPLVTIEELKTDYSDFSDMDLKKMELAIITVMKPLWNVQGVLAPYFFKEGNARKYFKK